MVAIGHLGGACPLCELSDLHNLCHPRDKFGRLRSKCWPSDNGCHSIEAAQKDTGYISAMFKVNVSGTKVLYNRVEELFVGSVDL